MKDFPQAGRHWPHFRPLDSLRQVDRSESLVEQLSSEIDVDVVGKRHDHLRQGKLGDRPYIYQAGQSGDGLFNTKGDLLFDFFGSQRRRRRVDLNLDGSRIRERINVDEPSRIQSQRDARYGRQDDDSSMPQRTINNPFEHGVAWRNSKPSFVRRSRSSHVTDRY